MSLYSVRNYLFGFRRISGVNILVQKKRISAIWWKIGIPVVDECEDLPSLSFLDKVFLCSLVTFIQVTKKFIVYNGKSDEDMNYFI